VGFIEAVGMGPNPACLGLFEQERKRVKHAGRAQPAEPVAPYIDVDAELVGVCCAHLAVDAIRCHDKVIVGTFCDIAAEFVFEVNHHAQCLRTFGQDAQQVAPSDSDKAVPAGTDGLTGNADFDVIPVRKALGHRRCAYRIIRHQIAHGLIRKDHTPAKRLTALVALEHVNFVLRIAQFGRNRKIQSGGSAAQAGNTHAHSLFCFRLKAK